MRHIHLEQLESTQKELVKYAKEYRLLPEDKILISCNEQTGGIGRQNNLWLSFENSLAFSFTCLPANELTLTPLEIAVHLVKFIEQVFDQKVKLKWPNDILLPTGEKCGGIICQALDGFLAAGIGLNVSNEIREPVEIDKKNKAGFLVKKTLSSEFQKQIPKEFYNYFSSNRLSNDDIISNWNQLCIHHKKKIRLIDGDNLYQGTFLGISSIGEAKILIGQNEKRFVTGSVFID